MAVFGFSPKSKIKKTSKKTKKPATTRKKMTSKSSEARAVLAKMQAKKDAGDCPFC